MNILAHESSKIPNDLTTKKNCVLRFIKSGRNNKKICNYYHISRQSLWRWVKQYNGTDESLENKSHKPLTKHPNSCTDAEITDIKNYIRRNPSNSYLECWINLFRNKNFKRCIMTVYRVLKRMNLPAHYKTNKKKKHDKIYNTPTMVGVKWQIDVKYVPNECKSLIPGDIQFYQYTILDECSRKRFLYYTKEHSMYETVKALKKSIEFFGFKPLILQSDNGFEFSDKARRTKGTPGARTYNNLLEKLCISENIEHKFIRPRTPQHNGKVERSHRIDQEKFYRNLKFYSLEDLSKQGAARNKRYNDMPKFVLGLKTPNEVEVEKLKELNNNTNEMVSSKCCTSYVN
jgi:transposase InsO family protein